MAVSNWLYGLLCMGRAEEGLTKAEAALALGEYAISDNLRNTLALAYLRLGRESEAAAHYRVLTEKAFDVNF